MKAINLTGKVFGLLTVLEIAKKDRFGIHWNCQCSCGKVHIVRGSHLRQGKINSCGCKQGNHLPHEIKHGHAMGKDKKASPEYYTWLGMKARCNNPKTKKFSLYGGRGITVCERWGQFENFLSDMGLRPSNNHSIDRFPDTNGNYEPGNCRWATIIQQNQNKNSNVYYEYGGKRQILEEWARELDADPGNIGKRLKLGYSFEEVYLHFKYTSKKRISTKGALYEHGGKLQTLTEWAKELGANTSNMQKSVKRGRSFSEMCNYYINKKIV